MPAEIIITVDDELDLPEIIEISTIPVGAQGPEGEVDVVELTQAQYDALPLKDPDTFYVITDAPQVPGPTGPAGAAGTAGPTGPAGPSGLAVVQHGTNANVARPAVPLVLWVGSADPVNALDYDLRKAE